MIDKNKYRPAPLDDAAFDTALAAFSALDAGAQTGEWDAFIAFLHDDLTWFGPVDGFQGLQHGKQSAADLFKHHAAVTRTHWNLKNIVANGNEIGFECWTEGTIEKKSYGNQLLMLFVIEEGKIRHFREYAGYINGVGEFVGHGDAKDGSQAYSYKGR